VRKAVHLLRRARRAYAAREERLYFRLLGVIFPLREGVSSLLR
jgi:hypothetical protein